MRCIQCNTDNNLKERTQHRGRCKKCNHPFVFNPKAGSLFTDKLFKHSVEAISSNETLYYTPKQLSYFLEKRLNQKSSNGFFGNFIGTIILCVFLAVPLFGIFEGIGVALIQAGFRLELTCILLFEIFFYWSSWSALNSNKLLLKKRTIYSKILRIFGFIIIGLGIAMSLNLKTNIIATVIFLVMSIGFGLLYIGLANRNLKNRFYATQDPNFDQRQLDSWLQQWQQVNSLPKILLTVPEISGNQVSSEITNYSFDRVVICDSDRLAHLLIKNSFHFEHNCAILSINQYPKPIFPTILEMLKRNPNLKAYAFHNADPQGVKMAHQLRTDPNWFGDMNIKIYDLGLQPYHVFNSRNMIIRQSTQSATEAKQLSSVIQNSLSQEELKWLEAGNYVELESFTPYRLLKVLAAGIAQNQLESIEEDRVNLSIFVLNESFG